MRSNREPLLSIDDIIRIRSKYPVSNRETLKNITLIKKPVVYGPRAPYRIHVRAYIQTVKQSSSCILCGHADPRCLVFHHRNLLEKLFSIAHAVAHGGYGLDRVKREISKCDILCCNCHAVYHYDNPVLSSIRDKKI